MGHGAGSGAAAPLVVGVLALQGAFVEHVHLFRKIGVEAIEVRLPEQLDGVDAIVLPGGESTTIALLARRWGLLEPLREWVAAGKPIWGTCAGMILLANKLTGKMKEGQETIGGLDATVHRNYFGSQLGSFSAKLKSHFGAECAEYTGVFIRAPAMVEHGAEVKVLATVRPHKHSAEAAEHLEDVDAVVAARQGNILVTSFHPELTADPHWHSFFHRMALDSRPAE